MTDIQEARRWDIVAIDRLRELAQANVPAEIVSEALRRPVGDVVSKAAELGLVLEPANPPD